MEAISRSNPIGKLFQMYFWYFERTPLFYPLISIGLHTWMMIVCGFINVVHRKKEWILSLPVLAIVMSLLISTPVYSEFRYIYSAFLMLPLVLMTTCVRVPEE